MPRVRRSVVHATGGRSLSSHGLGSPKSSEAPRGVFYDGVITIAE